MQQNGNARGERTLPPAKRDTPRQDDDIMSERSRTKSSHPGKDEYNTIPIPARIEDRPTEDDLARAALGGPKGSPELPAAPLTKTEDEQTLPNDDPGHVA
jgi:hypothetical protein